MPLKCRRVSQQSSDTNVQYRSNYCIYVIWVVHHMKFKGFDTLLQPRGQKTTKQTTTKRKIWFVNLCSVIFILFYFSYFRLNYLRSWKLRLTLMKIIAVTEESQFVVVVQNETGENSSRSTCCCRLIWTIIKNHWNLIRTFKIRS